MKKFLALLLAIASIFSLVACSDSTDDTQDVTPKYSSTYSYNETHHWREQTNGDGMTDYAEHQNKQGRCKCGGKYYFSDDVIYTLRYDADIEGYPILNEETGEPNFYYAVTEYLGEVDSDVHIEIPAYLYQPIPEFDENDEDYNEVYAETILEYAKEIEYPVLVIDKNVFKPTGNKYAIESIKLNEGLKKIGGSAFSGSSITEIIIPNSVEGAIYNICSGCPALRRAVIGDGVTNLEGYCFSSCSSLAEVILGKNVQRLGTRNFYCCSNIRYIVMPKSVVNIPESHIYTKSAGKYVTIYNQFQGAAMGSPVGIYLEITEEEYNDLLLPLIERDPKTGYPLDEDGVPIDITVTPNKFKQTTYGYVTGWNNNAKLYFKGEWHYDENGKPVAN